ncbi:MAG TPA: hypothetical protein VHW09_27210 [Bryobacteraceae bacterium]|jgi:hypothetical protein|nr:hypothetical protein [Bryobacteraceae bacterium]
MQSLGSSSINSVWREKLAEAERRYHENRTPENRVEFRRVLGIFSALVMRGVQPPAMVTAASE